MIYLDASALVALFVSEVHTSRARTVLTRADSVVALSDFAVAEASAALAARMRQSRADGAEVVMRYAELDRLFAEVDHRIATDAGDIAVATTFVRHRGLRLRAPDAVHLAICRRIGATLFTFDDDQASAATMLGIALA